MHLCVFIVYAYMYMCTVMDSIGPDSSNYRLFILRSKLNLPDNDFYLNCIAGSFQGFQFVKIRPMKLARLYRHAMQWHDGVYP